jgi:phosphoribosylanthranilate isomerase
MSVKVKICGVTTVADACAAVAAGADYLGLNFHPASPRFVDMGRAAEIAAAVRGVPLVGVFVDRPRDEVAAIADGLGLWAVQLHGDEAPDYCGGWDRPVIKALRARPGDDLPARAAQYATDYLLLDAWVAGVPGGTGVAIEPEAARGLPVRRLFVAGGLVPDRVADVVRALRPFAVDVASGVEREPGIKDHGKVEEFIRRAKAA